MEMEVQKKEEVINTLLDRIDGDVFTREQVRDMLSEALDLGYQEGAYDFGDKVSSCQIPTLAPIQQWQVDELTFQLEKINKICDNDKSREKLMEILFNDADKIVSSTLSSLTAFWNEKLKNLNDER